MATKIIHNPLADARIDENPRGTARANHAWLFRDTDEGITKHALVSDLLPQIPSQNFEWVPNKQPAYNLNESVTLDGVWYKSLVNNNTGIPGKSGTWQAMSNGTVSGGFYKPGVYAQDKIVVYSDHSGITEQYQLNAPSRPFLSTNIATEEAQGLWVSISGQLRRVNVAVANNELILDCMHQSQLVFIVTNNIESNTIVTFVNYEKLVWCKIRMVIAAPLYLQFPSNSISSDPLFNETGNFRKRFLDVGEYSMEITFDNVNFWIETYGPGRGTANLSPQIINHSIELIGGTLVRTRQYYDAEGDLENNPPPFITNFWMDGDAYPGGILEITYTFHSPMKYEEGEPLVQWYRMSEDFTNVTEIPGANDLQYAPVFDDKNFWVFGRLRVTQVAEAPANGNPISVEYTSNAKLIQEEVVGVEPLIPEEHFDNIMNLFDDNYDEGTFSIPDTGLWSGATAWTSPAPENRPTYDVANKRLRFDPAVTIRYIDAPIAASNAKGSSGTRRYDFVGVFELNTLPLGADEFAIWSILTSYLFKLKSDTFLHYQSSSGSHFPFGLEINKKYRFRLRTDINPVSGFIEAHLQVNYDEESETFEYDGTIQGTNGGAGIAAGSTIRLGGSKNVPPVDDFDGWWYEFALLSQAHVDAQYEPNLWRRLNLVAGL